MHICIWPSKINNLSFREKLFLLLPQSYNSFTKPMMKIDFFVGTSSIQYFRDRDTHALINEHIIILITNTNIE